jgi:F-type H+-transporting ATPase subunit gamma
MDSLESLRSKTEGAKDISAVVKSMKAMAASNIVQYEMAVASLGDYYHTVALGIAAYLKAEKIDAVEKQKGKNKKEQNICAIIFGSDQGLVGQFNDSMAGFVSQSLNAMQGKKEIWVIGERVQLLLSDAGFSITNFFSVPNDINAITPLINSILIKSEEENEKGNITASYIFHNQPKTGAGYKPVLQRFLPLDEKWMQEFTSIKWPAKNLPQIAGGIKTTLSALIREYLFTSLFKACAESLSSENASRLEAMQRAEKNIDELLDDLKTTFQRLRQSSIDEELFDVISGFEALKAAQKKIN